jgi:predicted amidophosphoribosyltransferase
MALRVIAELVALAVPPACVVCRAALPRVELRLCAACTRALPWLPARVCRACGLPSHRRGCPAVGAAFTRAWSPVAYDGVARDLVAALKFRAALPVAALMAAHIAANLPDDLRPPPRPAPGLPGDLRAPPPSPGALPGDLRSLPVVVPVPPQAARRRRRGFDPAGRLAAELAARLALPHAACLRRRDRERPQVGATRAQRRRAGRLAIELRAPPPSARVMLVDDVHTTGATLNACARALMAGGAREVIAITYARTL